MRKNSLLSVLVLSAVCAAFLSVPAIAGQQVAAKIDGDKLSIAVGGEAFTEYKFNDSQKYPYFWPVNGPKSGKSVTTETSEPFPHHHSLFFACDKVNGGNYWQEENERGQIISAGPRLVEAEGERVVFTDECMWRRPGQEPIIREMRTVTIQAPTEALRLIDFQTELTPLVDVRIEKTNHSLFSARMVHELSEKAGGVLLNAEGATGAEGTYGVKSPWCDYSGSRDGVAEGLAILQHPANRWYPSQYFNRDYGFFSPTPMFWLEDGYVDLPKGEPLVLRYRVVVHAGNAADADIAGLFDEYKKAAGQ